MVRLKAVYFGIETDCFSTVSITESTKLREIYSRSPIEVCTADFDNCIRT